MTISESPLSATDTAMLSSGLMRLKMLKFGGRRFMCNFKNRRADSLTKRYRIAKTPRPTAQQNIDSWNKIESHLSKHRSDTFDALAMVCSKHDHPSGGDGFVKYCIDSGWLKEADS